MAYKEGDILICKKRYRYDGMTPNVIFEFGKQYKVDYLLGYFTLDSGEHNIIYKIREVSFYSKGETRNIEDYFCDLKEYRLRKLRILNCK